MIIATIATSTCRQALRSRSFLLLMGVYVIGVLLTRIVGWIATTHEDIMTANLVFSLQSGMGVLVAIATGSQLIYTEIQQRTLYTILSRPLPRWHFVAGKYGGLALALLLGQMAMLLLGLAYLWATGMDLSWWLVLGGMMTIGEVLIMAGVSLMLTSLSGPLLSAVLSLAVYLLGHAVASLPDFINHLQGWKGLLAALWAALVPNLGRFTYRNEAVYGIPLDAGEALASIVYALAWIMLLLAVTVAVFRRKQL